MSAQSALGRVHSIQTLGTLDGPGVRFVIFTQGCPLRCACCHNPDTWNCEGGKEASVYDLIERALRYREYFGARGGVTLSGGEPLLQPTFAKALFEECHQRGLNTCLDTSGCILNEEIRELLRHTDRVLLDIKYPTDALYREYVGCPIEEPLNFLKELDRQSIPTTLRQVIIPGKNDTEEGLAFLADLANAYPCVDHVELLPFHKICSVKYKQMNIPFRFADIPAATQDDVARCEAILAPRLIKH